jgi:[NiFe] hydrogenase diaphorase moiety large subunit
MLLTERDRLIEQLEQLADRFGRDRGALIPILQELQRRRHRVDDFSQQVIADLLGIHPVEVHSVISFYSFLHSERKGRFVIRLCRTISCDMADKDRVARQLESDLGIPFGETTADGRFTLEWASCMGMCDHGPALLVNDKLFMQVTPETVHEIIQSCRNVFGLHATQRGEEHLA